MNNTTIYSRGELLVWINTLLGLHYTKIEECANGAAFCQIIDCLYRGTIRMKGVNFDASSEIDILANYKILQAGFSKNNIEKPIPVDSLIKRSYQATLEMLQWFRGFFEQNFTGGEYNGPDRRKEIKQKNNQKSNPPPKTPISSSRKLSAKTPISQDQVNRSTTSRSFQSST